MKNFLSLGLLVVAAGLVQAQTYTTLTADGGALLPWAINDSGETVGVFSGGTNNGYGFVRGPKGLVRKTKQGYGPTLISNAGEVAGDFAYEIFYTNSAGKYVRVNLFERSTYTPSINAVGVILASACGGGKGTPWCVGVAFNSASGVSTNACAGLEGNFNACMPSGINNSNQIVGSVSAAPYTPPYQGYLSSNGAAMFLNYPGAVSTQAISINDNQEIVGNWWDANNVEHGFYWNPTAGFSDIDVAGDTAMYLVGINNQSVILGAWRDDNSPMLFHYVTIQNGQTTSINVPKSQHGSTYARAINNVGQIVGEYIATNGQSAGFIYTPAK